METKIVSNVVTILAKAGSFPRIFTSCFCSILTVAGVSSVSGLCLAAAAAVSPIL